MATGPLLTNFRGIEVRGNQPSACRFREPTSGNSLVKFRHLLEEEIYAYLPLIRYESLEKTKWIDTKETSFHPLVGKKMKYKVVLNLRLQELDIKNMIISSNMLIYLNVKLMGETSGWEGPSSCKVTGIFCTPGDEWAHHFTRYTKLSSVEVYNKESL